MRFAPMPSGLVDSPPENPMPASQTLPLNTPTQAPSLETIIYRLGSVEMHLGSLTEKLEELSRGLLSQAKCTSPKACIGMSARLAILEKHTEDLFNRVGALERANEYSRGFGRGMIFAVGALGGVVGAFGGLILRKVFGV